MILGDDRFIQAIACMDGQASCQCELWAIVTAKNVEAFLVKEIRGDPGFLFRNKPIGLFRSQGDVGLAWAVAVCMG